ncbi:MAG: hypothetical protein H0U59_06565, partial [Gemmatimonadaceae bacterium]|nr:hypothetical protein [Gemmatimonadaceae bacterium]
MKSLFRLAFIFIALTVPGISAGERPELQVGIAGHAFDHLGEISDQADAAVASGMSIIYPGCFGQMGAEGLPAAKELEDYRKTYIAYVRQAKERGIKLSLAYV